jgi:hypothetical protein
MYQAMANSAVAHNGYKWIIKNENWKTVSEHIDRESAEREAARLNKEAERIVKIN